MIMQLTILITVVIVTITSFWTTILTWLTRTTTGSVNTMVTQVRVLKMLFKFIGL